MFHKLHDTIQAFRRKYSSNALAPMHARERRDNSVKSGITLFPSHTRCMSRTKIRSGATAVSKQVTNRRGRFVYKQTWQYPNNPSLQLQQDDEISLVIGKKNIALQQNCKKRVALWWNSLVVLCESSSPPSHMTKSPRQACPAIPEARFDLTAQIGQASVLAGQRKVTEVVQTHSRVVWRHLHTNGKTKQRKRRWAREKLQRLPTGKKNSYGADLRTRWNVFASKGQSIGQRDRLILCRQFRAFFNQSHWPGLKLLHSNASNDKSQPGTPFRPKHHRI